MRLSSRRSDDADIIRARLRALLAESNRTGGWLPDDDLAVDRDDVAAWSSGDDWQDDAHETVPIGEPTVVIAVSTPHRAACYEASRAAIDRLKARVPVWKKEIYADGEVWIGREADYQREIGRLA